MGGIIYKRADTDKELYGILNLQEQNLRENTSETEKEQEGFVTVQHDFEILNRMNMGSPHIIALHNNQVIGYALVMLKEFKDDISVLRPMFSEIDKAIDHNSYVTMGQVCIDKDYRRKGVFRGLYNCMKTHLKDKFSMIITEVDQKNIRSMNAHFAIGFKHLQTYHALGQDWELIYWDWT